MSHLPNKVKTSTPPYVEARKPGLKRERVQSATSEAIPFQLNLDLRPGEWVEVRSPMEIKAGLDAEGKLDGLPFMLEMLAFCGRRFQVSRRADSTCFRGMPRRMDATVHLDQLRCDGSAHQNCRALCLLLWKEAWLRRVPENQPASASESTNGALQLPSRTPVERPDGTMMCQATEIGHASCPMLLPSPARHLVTLPVTYLRGELKNHDRRQLRTFLRGKMILWLFTRWARAPWNSNRYRKTPSERLDLQPGELVRVRGAREILRTLDRNGCNRGMEFKPEMFLFCGRTFRVLTRMSRRIDEHSGQMREFRNECIILDSVYCHGQRSFCARGNYHYWREIWLRRS
ncbi:MAG: hypothetical protein ACREQ4_15640 [Candidatus Binataceae bacterium]